MKPVLVGFRFVQPLTKRQIPAYWLRLLAERQERADDARKGRAARMAKAMRARRGFES